MSVFRILRIAFVLFLLSTVTFSCIQSRSSDQYIAQLGKRANGINADLKKIRLEVNGLVAQLMYLYENQDELLKTLPSQNYQLSINGVFYKPINDGGSAVFVSGYIPVNEKIKRAVYFTEPIDSAFKRLVRQYPEIVQAYFNDRNSYNRIYPFFDVLSQYEAKMNIPSFNFYYLADLKHNPAKGSLWVDEPYVDPAGRGWMVSAIAPVYVNDTLVGVPGIDVTVNMLTSRYVPDEVGSAFLIVDKHGTIVAARDAAVSLLSFQPLQDHQYIETIKRDTYRRENYNILLSKDIRVRKLAVDVLTNNKRQIELDMNGEKMIVISAYIPETKWYLLEILK